MLPEAGTAYVRNETGVLFLSSADEASRGTARRAEGAIVTVREPEARPSLANERVSEAADMMCSPTVTR